MRSSLRSPIPVNCFRERTSSYKLEWVLNTPLMLLSNVIWHVHRLIAETKTSRLGVSLMCPLYIKEVWNGLAKSKLQKIKYINSNTENFKVCLQ